eukprot:GEMP01013285.1.p1 GENE.GEMP01013285.1~~GEMP01013285.1.p1  ORF type:complete len:651 (+),score=131.72 GEMP01013285.1:37-1953(+)
MRRLLCRIHRARRRGAACAFATGARTYETSASSRAMPSQFAAASTLTHGGQTLKEVAAFLRSHQGGVSSAGSTLNVVDATAQHAVSLINSDTPLSDLLSFAEACKVQKLKQPLLDVLLKINLDDTQDANVVAEILLIMGQAQLYPGLLFEWLYERTDRLSSRGMAVFLYECGRHGLRCKHFADRAVPRAATMVPDMSVSQVMMSTRGLIRFVRDWRIFFEAAKPVYLENLAELSDDDWALVLRLSKELNAWMGFRRLQELAVTAKDPDILPLSIVAQALLRVDKHKTIRMPRSVKRFVELSAATMCRRKDSLVDISVVEAIDALDSLSTWASTIKVDPELLKAVGDLLTERISEIKYSPNVALWSRATCALSKFHFYHEPWMHTMTTFARDKFILDKISFFQQCSFVAALARLGFADAESYQCIGDLMLDNADLIREPTHASPVLWSFTVPNQIHRPLFDLLVDKFVAWADDPATNSVVQSLYCFVAAGYHRSRDLTPLYKACFTTANLENPQFKRRLQVIRDVVAAEADVSLPEIPEFSHEIPTDFARNAARMMPNTELVPTYGPCTLMRLRPSEKYGMLLVDGAPLSTGEAPMEVILQGRVLAAQGWSLCPPLFARTPTWTEHGERYLQYWAAHGR